MRPFFDPQPDPDGVTAMDMLVIEPVLGMGDGYVLNFSDRTFNAFVARHFNVDVTAPMYTGRGPSKANRLRALIYAFTPEAQAEVLQAFLNHRRTLEREHGMEPLEPGLAERYQAIVARLARDAADAPNLEIERFTDDATLNALADAIERDIAANAPHAALDRLHTYCMKKFAALSEAAGLAVVEHETLQGRAGRDLPQDRQVHCPNLRAVQPRAEQQQPGPRQRSLEARGGPVRPGNRVEPAALRPGLG
jgi:hypothetical protein